MDGGPSVGDPVVRPAASGDPAAGPLPLVMHCCATAADAYPPGAHKGRSVKIKKQTKNRQTKTGLLVQKIRTCSKILPEQAVHISHNRNKELVRRMKEEKT